MRHGWTLPQLIGKYAIPKGCLGILRTNRCRKAAAQELGMKAGAEEACLQEAHHDDHDLS